MYLNHGTTSNLGNTYLSSTRPALKRSSLTYTMINSYTNDDTFFSVPMLLSVPIFAAEFFTCAAVIFALTPAHSQGGDWIILRHAHAACLIKRNRLDLPPAPRIPVTTGCFAFLVGDPYKQPVFLPVTLGGGRSNEFFKSYRWNNLTVGFA